MPVAPTDQWLGLYLKNKIGLAEYDFTIQRDIFGKKLSSFFSHTWDEIHQFLLQNGLFIPSSSDEKIIQQMTDKNVWGTAKEELNQLRCDWNGPDIPLFIFPSNQANDELRLDLRGKSGVAKHDKVVLFIGSDTSKQDLQALITHEYNHVCRLNYLNQPEEDITLLDGMILEGLAEVAVLNRLGEGPIAKWTSIYPLEYALEQWEKNAKLNLHVHKKDSFFHDFMYGNNSIPKWMGYNIGFHLVSSFAVNTREDMNKLLHLPAESILEKSAFSG
ncbi:hypothetical protein CFK37_02975 [Virgibacillus phasianinus]|uniref:DUF2268 domain-containing protein n=1 Tax=Virgibacillus phasianinus TaxID=2017483 RepID=A0A220TZM3_9BACI|nr:DUF2268 domain-containing putative Zn-dependent protease [Virgibacillus phasianinus]ASK61230.1 hypothetical protein CFK37_02975 [Virgibacillus phasianinus]